VSDIIADIEKGARMVFGPKPCPHQTIAVSLDAVDGRPCNPRCARCGIWIPVPQEELDRVVADMVRKGAFDR